VNRFILKRISQDSEIIQIKSKNQNTQFHELIINFKTKSIVCSITAFTGTVFLLLIGFLPNFFTKLFFFLLFYIANELWMSITYNILQLIHLIDSEGKEDSKINEEKITSENRMSSFTSTLILFNQISGIFSTFLVGLLIDNFVKESLPDGKTHLRTNQFQLVLFPYISSLMFVSAIFFFFLYRSVPSCNSNNFLKSTSDPTSTLLLSN
jgi:hypothetical protein